MSTIPPVTRIGTRLVYENRWLRLEEDRIRRADGSTGIFGVVRKRPYSLIVPWTGEHVVLVRQYRYAVQDWTLELPQGTADVAGQSPEETAAAELREETGYSAGDLVRLGSAHQAVGYSDQQAHIFLATGLEPGPQRLEPTELGLTVHLITVAELDDAVASGRVADISSVAAWCLARPKIVEDRRGRAP